MINPYHSKIDIESILQLQNSQYQNAIYTEITVPANDQVDQSVNISSLGHFMLLTITGAYSTKNDDQGSPVDNGINGLSLQLVDGQSQRDLFEDFVPAPIFLSPGRIKTLPASGSDSNDLKGE